MKHTISILLLGVMFLGTACSEKKDVSSSDAGTPPPAAPSNPNPPDEIESPTSSLDQPDDSTWGERANLVIDTSNFNDFTGRPGDEIPQDTRIYISLQETSDGYAGEVRIYYATETENNSFGSGGSTTLYKFPLFKSGEARADVQFNRWYDVNGNEHFVAFFEEQVVLPTGGLGDFTSYGIFGYDANARVGSIMIILDDMTGDDLGELRGTVYYRNFGFTYADKPDSDNENYRCWNIRRGPYDCREFLVNNQIDPVRANLRVSNYKRLGTFSNLFLGI